MRVKDNQPWLLDSLQRWFTGDPRIIAADTQVVHSTEHGHGRVVHYTLSTTTALNQYLQQERGWIVGQALQLERRCITLKTGEVETSVHYGITDLLPHQAPPRLLLRLWRQHWHIENKAHWVLDTVMDEDRSTARKDALPLALTLLRHAAISLLRLSGETSLTAARSRFSANPAAACSLIGIPLE